MWNPNIYQKPGVYWEELPTIGLQPNFMQYPLTIIGQIPADVSITEKFYLNSDGEELTNRIVDEDSIIVTSATGNKTYEENFDYTIIPASGDTNTILKLWSNGPTNLNYSVTPTGGYLEEGTYFYLVTAVSKNGLETTKVTTNNYVSNISVSGSGAKILLTWNGVENAFGYRIYRAKSGEILTLLEEISSTSTTYLDDGSSKPDGVTVPSTGYNVLVTYSYSQSDRYDVKIWTDVDDIEKFYGSAIDMDTGLINCPLSFAARKAALNGCQYIQTVAVQSNNLQGWLTALEKLKAVDELEIVVPLIFNSSFFSNCLSFIDEMNDKGIFPFFILGGDENCSEDDIFSAIPTGGNENLVMVGNPYVYHYNSINNTEYKIAGYYAAAAIGGKLLSQAVQVPLTKKIIYGISSVPKMTERKMNYYAQKGLLILYNRGNQVEVRHGLTTKMANSATKEISVVRAKHYMLRSLIEDINNSIIGTSLDEYTVISVKGLVVSRLDVLKNNRIISEYMDVKARLNTDEPTRVDIKFKYRPAWPINYVVIQFTVDMTTGEVVTHT